MAIAGPGVVASYDGPSTRWWLSPAIPPQAGELGNYLVCYAGMACMTLAWFAVLRRLRRPSELRSADLVVLGTIWALPLVAGPPLFSRDIYSYLAQGMLAHLQLSPYRYPPAVLGVVGFNNLLSTVSPVWRMTTAPYGPVFLSLAGWLAGVSGGQVTSGVVLFRVVELAGIALLVACLPKVAKQLGASPLEALWVGALSPLVMFELLSSGHNDAIMVGLLCAGLLASLQRRPLAGVALCSAATLFKLPALLAAAFIALSWAREQPERRAKIAVGAASAGVAAATLIAGSALTAGFGWISTSVVLVPDKVSTPVSPTKSLASLVHLVTAALGLGISGNVVSDTVRSVAMLIGAIAVVTLLLRVERRTLVPSVGAAMVVVALLGSDAWPWYMTWGVAPLAAWRPAQRSWLLLAAAGLFAFVVTPAGQVAVPDVVAPGVAFVWAGLALAFWKAHGPFGPSSLARPRSRRRGPARQLVLVSRPVPQGPVRALASPLVPVAGGTRPDEPPEPLA
jgi:alpha-1,6-mannosyltransferase